MYPRTKYEMTEEDLKDLMNAIKSAPMIMLQCGNPPSQQGRANSAWEVLGKKMGFDHMTVKPSGDGNRFFTAIPSETEQNKEVRLKEEAEERRLAELDEINSKLKDLEARKQELITDTQTDA